MELVINIEKVVINLNEPTKNINGLVTEKSVVEQIKNSLNENRSKSNIGSCSSGHSGQMPTHIQ